MLSPAAQLSWLLGVRLGIFRMRLGVSRSFFLLCAFLSNVVRFFSLDTRSAQPHPRVVFGTSGDDFQIILVFSVSALATLWSPQRSKGRPSNRKSGSWVPCRSSPRFPSWSPNQQKSGKGIPRSTLTNMMCKVLRKRALWTTSNFQN